MVVGPGAKGIRSRRWCRSKGFPSSIVALASSFRCSRTATWPPGFPLLFTAGFELIEPAVAYLHELAIRRAHTADTLNTYLEILYDWFDALEQSTVDWRTADAADLVAYRNRMLREPSAHTRRPYSVRTINHRVRGVLRFYEWMVRTAWLKQSELAGRESDFAIARGLPRAHGGSAHAGLRPSATQSIICHAAFVHCRKTGRWRPTPSIAVAGCRFREETQGKQRAAHGTLLILRLLN